jgi:hypothetical protein
VIYVSEGCLDTVIYLRSLSDGVERGGKLRGISSASDQPDTDL